MTVLLLATAELKDELLTHPVNENIELKWITAPGDSFHCHTTDACIDLLFENTSERINWLKDLQCPLIIVNSVATTLQQINDHFIRINGWLPPDPRSLRSKARFQQLASRILS